MKDSLKYPPVDPSAWAEDERIVGREARRIMEEGSRELFRESRDLGYPGTVKNSEVYRYVTSPVYAQAIRKHTELNMEEKLEEARSAFVEAQLEVIRARDSFALVRINLEQEVRTFLNELRSLRMAIDSEVATVVRDLKELDSFIAGQEGREHLNRMRELGDACERLKEMQRNGILPALMDSLVKVMEAKRDE